MAARKQPRKKKPVKVRIPVPPASKVLPDRKKEADRKACRKPVEPEEN